jgi:hypothetical protein
VLAAAACSTPHVSVQSQGNPVLVQAEQVLAGPAAGICRDGDRLLVLEASGARLVALDSALVPCETIEVNVRLTGPRGCAADRYYYYLCDDRNLYRRRREADTFSIWLGNIRAAGLASFSVGEMLVSDAGGIYLKTVFGSSRRLVTAADVPQPGALAALPKREFCVLSGTNQLVFFNRSGIVTRRLTLGAPADLLTADSSGTVYVGRTGSPRIEFYGRAGSGLFTLPEPVSPTGLTAPGAGLAVLDSGTRVIVVNCR